MNILFVDDQPEFKVQYLIDFLEKKKIPFSYKIIKSSNSARRYVINHLNEIDLAIVDLGLPVFDDGSRYDSLEGLYVVDEILHRNNKIPVIIHSSTFIPGEEEYMEDYTSQNAKVIHIPSINFEWFEEFLQTISH